MDNSDFDNVYAYFKKRFFLFCPPLEGFLNTLYSSDEKEERVELLIDLISLLSPEYSDLRTTRKVEEEMARIVHQVGICETPTDFLQIFDDDCPLQVKKGIYAELFKYLNYAVLALQTQESFLSSSSSSSSSESSHDEWKPPRKRFLLDLDQTVDVNDVEEEMKAMKELLEEIIETAVDQAEVEQIDVVSSTESACCSMSQTIESVTPWLKGLIDRVPDREIESEHLAAVVDALKTVLDSDQNN